MQMFSTYSFHAEKVGPVFLGGDFDVGLGFTFFIFQWTIQQQNPRLLDRSPHAAMGQIFLNHDAM